MLLAAIFLITIFRHYPWDSFAGGDQSKQAFTSLEMVQKGTWWYQRLPTGRPATKPPLMSWISAVLYFLSGGIWPLAWRLPSLLAFGSTLWLLGRAGGRVGGRWGVWIAVAVYGLNMMSVKLAAMIRTDMLLCLWITVAGGMIWNHVRSALPWSARERAVFAAVVLAALFTKGPVILAHLVPPLIAWRWIRRRLDRSAGGGPGLAVWLAPCAVFGLWVLVGVLRDSAFFRWVVLREFGNNFAQIDIDAAGRVAASTRGFQSLLLYPLHLLHRLLPWSAALLGWGFTDREGRRRLRNDPGARWLMTWLGAALLAMSLTPSKRVDRVFPAVAPFALLTAYVLRHGAGAFPRPVRVRRAMAWTVAAALLWGPYTFIERRHNDTGFEGTRREFGVRVRHWANETRRPITLVGPVDEDDQSLPLHLRLTKWISPLEVDAALARGEAVVAPANLLESRAGVSVILRQRTVPGQKHRYVLGVPTSSVSLGL